MAQRKLRILVINSCVSGGGPGRGLTLYLEHAAHDLDFHVVLPQPGVIGPKIPANVTIHIVPELLERPLRPVQHWARALPGLNLVFGLANLASASRRIRAIAQAIDADLVYANHMLAKPVAAWVGARANVPVVLHARNIHSQRWTEKYFFQNLGRRRHVKAIIANSEATAACFREATPEKVTVIPNFVDLKRFDSKTVQGRLRSELGLKTDALVVGYLGRLAHWKGVDHLIEAFARVAADIPQAVLAIVGDNDSGRRLDLRARYTERAAAIGLSDRIHLLGFRDDVRPYLVDFDVLTLPSTAPEPFGRVLIEAMALGVPPLIYAHGGATEVVRDRKDGLWARPLDIDDLASKLTELLTNDELRTQCAESAAGHARLCFDAETLSRSLSSALRCAAAHPDAAAVATSGDSQRHAIM